MNNPIISIVTVCYNARPFIEKTILSVISQTYNNIEYIIIDGLSKDGTIDILRKYSDKISIIVSEPDYGIYDAMNKALRIANGDYLLFLGADDVVYNSNTIENVSKYLSNPNAVYYGNVMIKEKNKVYDGKFNVLKWSLINVCHQSIFYPKSIYKSHSYDMKYKVFADYVYNLSLLGEKVRFIYMDCIISFFDISGFSSYTKDPQFEKNRIKLVRNSLGIIPALFLKTYNVYRSLIK